MRNGGAGPAVPTLSRSAPARMGRCGAEAPMLTSGSPLLPSSPCCQHVCPIAIAPSHLQPPPSACRAQCRGAATARPAPPRDAPAALGGGLWVLMASASTLAAAKQATCVIHQCWQAPALADQGRCKPTHAAGADIRPTAPPSCRHGTSAVTSASDLGTLCDQPACCCLH